MFAVGRPGPGGAQAKASAAQRMLFPQILGAVQDFVTNRVEIAGNAEREDLALAKYRGAVVDRLLEGIVPLEDGGESALLPRIERHRGMGTTDGVQFRTTKDTRGTTKSHISHVVQDSTWEGSAAYHLEQNPHVFSYAKNERLDFVIEYTFENATHPYTPDFLVALDLDDGRRVTLILEIKGQESEQDRQKDAAARKWVRAVNNHGGFGTWAYAVCRGPNALIDDLARWRKELLTGTTSRPLTARPPSGAPKSATATPARVEAAPPKPTTSAVSQEHVGDYVLLGKIGGGGMAECYRGRAPGGEIVFVKRARVGSGDDDALQRESDIYGRLQYSECAHVLAVHDVHRGDGYVSLVTEFGDGGDLKQYVEKAGKSGLPLRQAIPIAIEVAKGLAELHTAGIVHRDLKPENVLRVNDVWKLVDFGISKNVSQATPGKTFLQAGTLGYAPPEQFEGDQATASMDIYSFGKMLTFLLTGATDPDKIGLAYRDLRRLVSRCIHSMPERRPDIAEVLSVLKGMDGEST